MSLSDKILKGHHTDYSNGKVILLNRGVSWTGVSGQAFHLCNQGPIPARCSYLIKHFTLAAKVKFLIR